MSDQLPFWPRYLTRELAAKYLGVGVDVFDDEVKEGLWPAPRRRGGKGGRLTWDIKLLDHAADQFAGIQRTLPESITFRPGFDPEEARWVERIKNGRPHKAGA